MSTGVGRARIGQWYLRRDKGELFQVTGLDEPSGTIEIQTFDGDLDEIDEAVWVALPLGFAEPPEDSTGSLDDVETDALGYSETDMTPSDWAEALEPARAGQAPEVWQDSRDETEQDPESKRLREPLSPEDPSLGEWQP